MQCTSSFDEDSSMMTNMDDSVIPQCEGIPRWNWTGKCVVLQNVSGAVVAEGIYRNVSSDDVIGSSGPLGDSHVAVQISSSLSEIDVPDEWRYLVRAWAIERVYCNGASLKDHEIRATHNSRIAALAMGFAVRKSRPYRSSICIPPAVGSTKARKVLQQQQINLVASKDCCSRCCAQTFPREKIKLLRERMYVGTTLKISVPLEA